MFKCPRCEKNFDSYGGLARHTAKSYKLKGEQLYREYHDIKQIPICKCGCGAPTKWRIDRGYAQYVTGHNSIGENNFMFGKTHSKLVCENISKKRKEKFANGEYDFIDTVKWSDVQKKVWSQDGYKEKMKDAREKSGWREKISMKMSGKNNPWYGKKRPEHSKLMKSPEMMSKIFANRSMTDIEKLMINIMDQIDIPYYFQFFITHDTDTYAYDFKIKDLPILVEVDGDYWHGGPSSNKHVPFVNQIQEKDDLKTKIAGQHGYTVLRFWGSDLKERPFWVAQQILQSISNN